MDERMQGRKAIGLSKIQKCMQGDDIPGDWVAIGIIAQKSLRKDRKGNPYTILKMTNLRDTVVNVFLFGKSHSMHSNEKIGSVIAILNPEILLPFEV